MWDDYHIFLIAALVFTRLLATRWYLTFLSNYHFIDWLCEVCLSLFTWWFDTRFLLQQSWYKKPVDSNSYRLLPLYYKRTDQPSLPVHYFARRLVLVSNNLWMIVDYYRIWWCFSMFYFSNCKCPIFGWFGQKIWIRQFNLTFGT